MADTWDVAVVGLGVMGAAVLRALAVDGARVIGLEQFLPLHPWGSSHGESRIIRQAYFEHPHYVPLCLRAYTLWRELESEWSLPLLTETGGLMLGRPDSPVVAGALHSAKAFDLPHECLDAETVRRRFPAFRPNAAEVAVYEPQAGFLRAEPAWQSLLASAWRYGAQTRFDEPVVGLQEGSTHVEVETRHGRLEAGMVVLTAGAWTAHWLPQPLLPLQVERQVVFWWKPAAIERFLQDRCPIYVWETADGPVVYGFPTLDQRTVKGAVHHGGQLLDRPEAADRKVGGEESAVFRRAAAERMPELTADLVRSAVCLYTNTPDGDFAVGAWPGRRRVLVAAGFSGHGFKFAPVIGEALRDMASGRRASPFMDFLDPARFLTRSKAP